MLEVTLVIETGNDAFQNGMYREEVANIMRSISASVVQCNIGVTEMAVLDSNGNRIGLLSVKRR